MNEKASRIADKRGGGSYEKYRSQVTSNATKEDTIALVQRLQSRLNLTNIKNPERGYMGTAKAAPGTLTIGNISKAVADLGATNIKYTNGVDGLVTWAHIYFELDNVVYALKVREFDHGGNTLDFGEYSKWS